MNFIGLDRAGALVPFVSLTGVSSMSMSSRRHGQDIRPENQGALILLSNRGTENLLRIVAGEETSC